MLYKLLCLFACLLASLPNCLPTCLCACFLACLPICLPACFLAFLLPACLLAYLLPYLLSCLLASLLACLPAFLYACLLACFWIRSHMDVWHLDSLGSCWSQRIPLQKNSCSQDAVSRDILTRTDPGDNASLSTVTTTLHNHGSLMRPTAWVLPFCTKHVF